MSISKSHFKINTTSSNEKLVPNLGIMQEKFQNDIKHMITEYAFNARKELNKNIKIKEHISRIKYINDLIKKLLTDIMKKKIEKEEIKNLLIKFNDIFKEDNSILKNDINEEYKKYIKYNFSLKNEIMTLKEKLNQLKNLNFILENKIIYKKNFIIRNRLFMIMPNNNNFIELYINEDSQNFDLFLTEISKIYQDSLLNCLKELNHVKTKNIEREKKIEKLKKILNNNEELLDYDIKEKNEKKIIKKNTYENSILSFKEFELMTSLSTIENIEKKIEEDGIEIKPDIFNLPQKNLINTNINEICLKNEIDKNVIKKKNYSLDCELPKLNLKQIKFNKYNQKYMLSSNIRRKKITLKRLTKRNEPETQKKAKKILKSKIKQAKENIKKNKNLIKEFKKFYSTIIDKYDNIIYQPDIESYVLSMEGLFV